MLRGGAEKLQDGGVLGHGGGHRYRGGLLNACMRAVRLLELRAAPHGGRCRRGLRRTCMVTMHACHGRTGQNPVQQPAPRPSLSNRSDVPTWFFK